MTSEPKSQSLEAPVYISAFDIPQMDCPCEEQLIRMKLADFSAIRELRFDLSDRRLEVIHGEDVGAIAVALESLNLGSRILTTNAYNGPVPSPTTQEESYRRRERQVLWWVLVINLVCFFIELTYGILTNSMGLVADGLDMLADAIVYGLALWAIGASSERKRGIALGAGVLQIFLAAWGLIEVVERFMGASDGLDFWTMILVSLIALAGNTASLLILNRSGNREAHFEASRIFTSGDIIVNVGVILSAVAVALTGTRYPDLVVGALVFLLVLRGGIRIIRLSQRG